MRDYYKEPLKRGENIPFEEIYDVYIRQNYGSEATARIFNTTRMVIRRHLRLYDIHKDKNAVLERVSQTFADKFVPIPYEELYDFYIVNHNSIEDGMNHFNINKYGFMKNLEYYGIVKTTEEVALQYKQTCLRRYGVDSL